MAQRFVLIAGVMVAMVIAAGGFWYLRQEGYRSRPGEYTAPAPGPQITEEQERKEQLLEIVGYVTSSAGTEVFTVNVEDAKRRIVFTDRDESLKIKTLRSIFGDGRKVLAHLSKKTDQMATVLGVLTIEGTAGIKILLENFGASEAPIASPDGRKVAYIVFSNADPDVGYSVMVMNTDGSNKRRLARSDRLITSLAFSPDGTKLAYIADTGDGTAIQTVKADGSLTSLTIAEYPNETVYDLSWGKELIFGKRPRAEAEANKGEIYTLTEIGTGLKRITTNNEFDGNPILSNDGKTMALLRTNFSSGKYSTAGEMTLLIVNLDNDKETELGSADGILGFRVSAAASQRQ